MSIKDWSTTATGNASVAGINFSEGQAPATLNNSMRELMAQVRTEYDAERWGWVAYSASASVNSQTVVKTAGNITSDAVANRAIKLTGGSTTVYATIVSSSFTSETTITLEGASGSLSASHGILWLSSVYGQNIPGNVVTGSGTATLSAAVVLGSASFSASVHFTGPVDVKGAISVSGVAAFHESVSFSASVQFNDAMVVRPYFKDYAEVVNAEGGGGGTIDLDISAGNVITATVDTSTTTFTFSNPSASGRACSFTLVLTNGGSQTVNWPASVDWAGGTAPTLTTSGIDILEFFTINAGTTWYGFAAGLDMQ